MILMQARTIESNGSEITDKAWAEQQLQNLAVRLPQQQRKVAAAEEALHAAKSGSSVDRKGIARLEGNLFSARWRLAEAEHEESQLKALTLPEHQFRWLVCVPQLKNHPLLSIGTSSCSCRQCKWTQNALLQSSELRAVCKQC